MSIYVITDLPNLESPFELARQILQNVISEFKPYRVKALLAYLTKYLQASLNCNKCFEKEEDDDWTKKVEKWNKRAWSYSGEEIALDNNPSAKPISSNKVSTVVIFLLMPRLNMLGLSWNKLYICRYLRYLPSAVSAGLPLNNVQNGERIHKT